MWDRSHYEKLETVRYLSHEGEKPQVVDVDAFLKVSYIGELAHTP